MKNSVKAVCPFYKWKTKGCILCEGGALVLGKEKVEQKWNVLCTELNLWDSCTRAQKLIKRYEG